VENRRILGSTEGSARESSRGLAVKSLDIAVNLTYDISSDRLCFMNSDSFRSRRGSERRRDLNRQADISELIRELRKRTGLTQEKFAAKLGVTFPTINRWENGRAKPSPLALQRIEELLRTMGENGEDLLKSYFS